MSTSSQRAALSFFARAELEWGDLLYRAQNHGEHTHTCCQITGSVKKEGRKRERECIYGDILLLMSAPPLGSISLTFMLDHGISPSFSLSIRPYIPSLFTHYPVSFPFALHESHTFPTSAASATRRRPACVRVRTETYARRMLFVFLHAVTICPQYPLVSPIASLFLGLPFSFTKGLCVRLTRPEQPQPT